MPQNTAVFDQHRYKISGTGWERTMASVTAIRDGMEPQLDLGINNVLHGGVFDTCQLLLPNLAIVHVCTCLEEILRAKKRA